MIRVSLVRALRRACSIRVVMASAVLAGALSLAGCYGDEGYQIPTRAMKELSPEMLALLQKRNMPKESPILIRVFKEESELEVWKEDTTGRYALLKVYPICRWSGDLGPKVREGDRQAPEGFYAITPGLMNPNSNYYLAINTGFPNAFDRANGYSGAFLMIHGDCSSRGCYAMTDEQIGEIYSLAREAFLGGEKSFQLQAYPFRMTPANLARHRNNPNMPFWRMIKEGNDHFEVSRLEPKVEVCGRHYVFDAVPPPNSTRPLNFSPVAHCPPYQIDPAIAQLVQQKQQNDDYKFAELVKENVAVAPLKTNTDGGMNRVFVAKLDNPTYTYDNEGHLHVPPLQPGNLPPEISPPRGSESETTAAIDTPAGSESHSFFGGLFGAKTTTAPAPVAVSTAPAPPPQHSGFFGNLFSTGHNPPVASPPPQTVVAAAPPTRLNPAKHHNQIAAAAGLRPRTAEPHKLASRPAEHEQAGAAKPPAANPTQEANAIAPPPPSNGGLIQGAQPVMPSGNFDSRWAGVQ